MTTMNEVNAGTGLTEGQWAEVQALEAAGIDYRRADELTAKLTAFPTFFDMLNAKGGYRPSIGSNRTPERKELADLYDAAQGSRGDARRASRW